MRAYFAPGSWQHGELVADDENTPNTDAARSQFAARALPRTAQFLQDLESQLQLCRFQWEQRSITPNPQISPESSPHNISPGDRNCGRPTAPPVMDGHGNGLPRQQLESSRTIK